MHNTTLSKECIALFDDERPDRIHLLQNSVKTWTPGQAIVYWETLPLELRADANNPAAMAHAMERTRTAHNRVTRELQSAIAPILVERDAQRQSNLDTLRAVTIAHGGLREVAPDSDLSRQCANPAPETEDTRHGQQASAADDFLRSLTSANSTPEE
jgi:hypothetical protein